MNCEFPPTFPEAFSARPRFLLEGALGVRLRAEYGIDYDEPVAMAGLVYDPASREALLRLWAGYMAIARRHSLPFIATTPTRRTNRDRVAASRFGDAVIADNVRALLEIRDGAGQEMYVGGSTGCRGDPYRGTDVLDEDAARDFHLWTVERFAGAGAEFLYAMIMPSASEAAGLARACAECGMPLVISFMIRDDGRLVDGTPIAEAMARIDGAADGWPLGYMVNCVHPRVLAAALSRDCNRSERVAERFIGIQPNASSLPPHILDGSGEVHNSDPEELAEEVFALEPGIRLRIVGGCCGTDESHLEAIAKRLASRS